MVHKNPQSDKERGSSTEFDNNKTAVITIDLPGDGDSRTVEAEHYIRSDDGTVSIYLSARSEGIGIQTHVSRCVIDRVESHDNGGEDQARSLVADGGRELVSGTDVIHAGAQWRVARCDGDRVEIYQLGNGSDIVPISTVEVVPEVQG